MFLIVTCGCLQKATDSPAITPAVQSPVNPVMTVPLATTNVQKALNFSVIATQKTVNITYNGGPDAADLVSLDIRINNMNGQVVEREIVNPVIGYDYVFTYRGVVDAKTVNIIGNFNGGYQQTVLMYYL